MSKAIEAWTAENQPLGEQLGYPECCIKEFCDMPPEIMKHRKPKKIDRQKYNAGCIDGEFTGFIPCAKHAEQIRKGEITLESLIDLKKRDSDLMDFPHA